MIDAGAKGNLHSNVIKLSYLPAKMTFMSLSKESFTRDEERFS